MKIGSKNYQTSEFFRSPDPDESTEVEPETSAEPMDTTTKNSATKTFCGVSAVAFPILFRFLVN